MCDGSKSWCQENYTAVPRTFRGAFGAGENVAPIQIAPPIETTAQHVKILHWIYGIATAAVAAKATTMFLKRR